MLSNELALFGGAGGGLLASILAGLLLRCHAAGAFARLRDCRQFRPPRRSTGEQNVALLEDETAGRNAEFRSKISAALMVAAWTQANLADFDTTGATPRRRALVGAILEDVSTVSATAARIIAANSSVDKDATDTQIQNAVDQSLTALDYIFFEEPSA